MGGDLARPVGGLIPMLASERLSLLHTWLRYSDLGWAAMWARRYSAAGSSPALFRAHEEPWDGVKKKIKFPPERKAP